MLELSTFGSVGGVAGDCRLYPAKAARGTDGRVYPWGDEWNETKCNALKTGLGRTCAVGLFPEGASPYGCFDMAGNVWEWTSSLWGKDWSAPEFKYPYNPRDGREKLEADDNVPRVLRGGAFNNFRNDARCACRYRRDPRSVWYDLGFRIMVAPISPTSALRP
jgi:iron(II)-dependent oxidoreductase